MIYDRIFKNKQPLFHRLLSFSFVFDKNAYVYSRKIIDDQFELIVVIAPDGRVRTELVDSDTGDEYTLHLTESAVGSFIGSVRTEYLDVLQTIADCCFETKIFQSEYANETIRYIKDKYHQDLEYLWPKFPENAVVRRSDNRKWYAAFLTVERRKIGLEGKDKAEIIDLRADPEEIQSITDGKKYFAGYHMNKKHWMTICLDGSVDLREICDRIDKSYALARK